MRPGWHAQWRAAAVGIDYLGVTLGLAGAAALQVGFPGLAASVDPGPSRYLVTVPWAIAAPLWIAVFAVLRLYSPLRTRNAVEEARRLMIGALAAPVSLIVLGFFTKRPPSRLWVVTGAMFALIGSAAGRRLLRWLTVRARRRGRWTTPAVVIGRTEAKRVVQGLLHMPISGLRPVATCGFGYEDLTEAAVDDLPALIRERGIGAVIVTTEDLGREEVRRAVSIADDLPVELFVLPGLDYMLLHSLQLVPVGFEPALALEAPSLRTYQAATKRAFDVAAATAMLCLAAPVMAATALVVRLDSRGPVLFRQRRIGFRGREFTVLKFRTMVNGAEGLRPELVPQNERDGVLFKIRRDPRVTRVGRFLRRTSLDELPQLWNVIRGDMSLVGPRPALPEEVAAYDGLLRRRLNVRPGLTGLWQISGRSDLAFEDYIRLDVTYAQNWNLLLDLYIMLRTPIAVVRRRGAY